MHRASFIIIISVFVITSHGCYDDLGKEESNGASNSPGGRCKAGGKTTYCIESDSELVFKSVCEIDSKGKTQWKTNGSVHCAGDYCIKGRCSQTCLPGEKRNRCESINQTQHAVNYVCTSDSTYGITYWSVQNTTKCDSKGCNNGTCNSPSYSTPSCSPEGSKSYRCDGSNSNAYSCNGGVWELIKVDKCSNTCDSNTGQCKIDTHAVGSACNPNTFKDYCMGDTFVNCHDNTITHINCSPTYYCTEDTSTYTAIDNITAYCVINCEEYNATEGTMLWSDDDVCMDYTQEKRQYFVYDCYRGRTGKIHGMPILFHRGLCTVKNGIEMALNCRNDKTAHYIVCPNGCVEGRCL